MTLGAAQSPAGVCIPAFAVFFLVWDFFASNGALRIKEHFKDAWTRALKSVLKIGLNSKTPLSSRTQKNHRLKHLIIQGRHRTLMCAQTGHSNWQDCWLSTEVFTTYFCIHRQAKKSDYSHHTGLVSCIWLSGSGILTQPIPWLRREEVSVFTHFLICQNTELACEHKALFYIVGYEKQSAIVKSQPSSINLVHKQHAH